MPPKGSRRRSVKIRAPSPKDLVDASTSAAAQDAVGGAIDNDIVLTDADTKQEETIMPTFAPTQPEPAPHLPSSASTDEVHSNEMGVDAQSTLNSPSQDQTPAAMTESDGKQSNITSASGPSRPRAMFRYSTRKDVTRKSKEELEAQRAAEEAKEKARVDAAARNTPRTTRGRGRGGSRGGRGGRKGSDGLQGLASGPLGEWTAAPQPARRATSFNQVTTISSTPGPSTNTPGPTPQQSQATPGSVKQEASGSPERARKTGTKKQAETKSKSKKSKASFEFEDDEENDAGIGPGSRKSIDFISLLSDEDDEGDDEMEVDSGEGRKRSLSRNPLINFDAVSRPIRVGRIEHGKKDSRGLESDNQDDYVIKPNKETSDGVEFLRREDRPSTQVEDSVSVKPEPSDNVNLDTAAGPSTEITLPTVKHKKRGKKNTFREARSFIPQTPEEHAELKRTREKTADLKKTLISFHPDNDITENDMADGTSNSGQAKFVQIQFPALMANLVRKNTERVHTANPDVMEVISADTPAPTAGQQSDTAIKVEDDPPPPKRFITAVDPSLPAGRAGTLRIHQSGRVTMDWGGIPFEVDGGMEITDLRNLVLIPREQGEPKSKNAICVGQVKKKLIVTPDWDALLK